MLQSNREQISVAAKDSSISRAEKDMVPALLLQYHHMYLNRTIANRISSRVLFLLIAGGLASIDQLSLVQIIAMVSTAFVLAFIWHHERQLLMRRQKGLEKLVSEHSTEEWEDTFSQFKYQNSKPIGLYKPSHEPFLWLLFICLLGFWRFYLQKKFGY